MVGFGYMEWEMRGCGWGFCWICHFVCTGTYFTSGYNLLSNIHVG
jgi:hypothetical protein